MNYSSFSLTQIEASPILLCFALLHFTNAGGVLFLFLEIGGKTLHQQKVTTCFIAVVRNCIYNISKVHLYIISEDLPNSANWMLVFGEKKKKPTQQQIVVSSSPFPPHCH